MLTASSSLRVFRLNLHVQRVVRLHHIIRRHEGLTKHRLKVKAAIRQNQPP